MEKDTPCRHFVAFEETVAVGQLHCITESDLSAAIRWANHRRRPFVASAQATGWLIEIQMHEHDKIENWGEKAAQIIFGKPSVSADSFSFSTGELDERQREAFNLLYFTDKRDRHA